MTETHITAELVSDYFDRKLAADETLRLFAHIEGCLECAEVFDRMHVLRRTYPSRFMLSVPSDGMSGHIDEAELTAIVEGSIDDRELDLLEHHIEHCDQCSHRLSAFYKRRSEVIVEEVIG